MEKRKSLSWILTLLMFCMVFFSVQQTQAVLVISENFNTENPVGWEFQSWLRPTMYKFIPGTEPSMSVIDGSLRAPNSTSHSTVANALFNSSVAYGSWSFDWSVASGSDRLAYDAVPFIFTDTVNNYNQTGLSEQEFLADCFGYGLLLISSSNTSVIAGVAIPGISLASYSPIYNVLGTHEFPSDIVGTHHIDIFRDLQGKFRVYFDSQIIINAIDNITSTSEKFDIVSFKGDSGFDNITISDLTVETTTTTTTTTTTATTTTPETSEGFHYWMFVPTMIVLIIWRKYSKKGSK